MLGFDVSERTISRWMRKAPRNPELESAPRFLIFDRDAKNGTEVPAAIQSMSIRCVRTSLESPGRTELRSAGSRAAAGTYWIT